MREAGPVGRVWTAAGDDGGVTSLLDRAAALADDVLYPAAAEVDASGTIPPSHFAALAGAGLYGIALTEPAALPAVTEVLAGGCLATTFTWMQHHGPVRTLAALGDPRLAGAGAGGLRWGVALAGGGPDRRSCGPPAATAGGGSTATLRSSPGGG